MCALNHAMLMPMGWVKAKENPINIRDGIKHATQSTQTHLVICKRMII